MSKVDDYKRSLNPEQLANHNHLVDVLTDLELTRTYGPEFGLGLIEFDPRTQPAPEEPEGPEITPAVKQVAEALTLRSSYS